MNNTQIFSDKAKLYNKSRAQYAQSFIDYLSKSGIKEGTKVADIGSGTGILTKQLLELNAEVYAVEPNNEMRAFAESNLGSNANFHSINAAAENTTLPDDSMNFITVAQAFHWFDPKQFKKECQRILKKDGIVILVWNNGLRTEEADTELKRINNKYHKPQVWSNKVPDVETAVKHFFTSFEKKEFPNDIHNTEEQYIEQWLSKSHAPIPTDKNYNDFIKDITSYAKKISVNGIITIPNITVAFIGKIGQ